MNYIPTPSTKGILKLIKEDLNDKWVLDLCCGSGWIGKVIKDLYPEAHIVCSDIRDDEFDKEDESIYWRKSDLFGNLAGKFSLLVMNPPYLPTSLWREELTPRVAYDGGIDGFDIIARFLEEFKEHITEDGMAIIEIHDTHKDRFPDGWKILKDEQGIERYAIFGDL